MGKTKRAGLWPIGRVAQAAGVSPQTIRSWEMRGYLVSTRTDGGQRLFTDTMMKRATKLASQSRRLKRTKPLRGLLSSEGVELASTGMRIKRARLEKGLSQVEAARRIGISRSFLSTVERGQSGVSTTVLARMASVFDIPMSGFAAASDPAKRVMRASDRPLTVLAEGVAWEELASPRSHDLEPALLYVPAGATSGGTFIRPGEAFVFLLEGSLAVRIGEASSEMLLHKGDALIVDPGAPISWRNPGKARAVAIWVELIGLKRERLKPAVPPDQDL